MGRKPKYENPQSIIDAFFAAVSDSYRHPGKDEVGDVSGRKKQELLAEEFGISRIKVRKILITTGEVVYPQTAEVQKLIAGGMKMGEVCEKMKMASSTINSFLPYSKGVYKLSEVSAAAERTALYRARKAALTELREKMDERALWKCICRFSGYPFLTAGRKTKDGVKGQERFKYTVSKPGSSGGRHYEGEVVPGFGNEMWISTGGEQKKKSISRSTVDRAFQTAIEKEIKGPKALNVPGAHSYLFPILVRFGVISTTTSTTPDRDS